MEHKFLTEENILAEIKGSWAGKRVKVFSETDSTNTQCRKLAVEGWPEGTLVVSEYQRAGKGRRGRAWVSPAGTGIWMSLLLRPELPPQKVSMVTLIAAMAVEKGIRLETGLDSQIKWPNDLVIGQKKICGILTEMQTQKEAAEHVVVGMGINANIREFPEEVRDSATSLYQVKGEETDRERLIGGVMAAFEEYWRIFLETGDLRALKEEYNEKLINRERQVQILEPEGGYTGLCRGIGPEGELLVVLPDGQVKAVFSGEVSVRGVYGYV